MPQLNAATLIYPVEIAPPGGLVLLKRADYAIMQVVWHGEIDAPIEDAEFDGIGLNAEDYERLKPYIDGEKPVTESAPKWLRIFREIADRDKKT